MAQQVQVCEGVTKMITKPGHGRKPERGNTITVHCTGSLENPRKKFWSTKDPGQSPFSFQVGLGKVIAGWDEGCMTMCVGEVATLTIVGSKGYGAGGFPAWGIPPNATLVFEMEVLSIK